MTRKNPNHPPSLPPNIKWHTDSADVYRVLLHGALLLLAIDGPDSLNTNARMQLESLVQISYENGALAHMDRESVIGVIDEIRSWLPVNQSGKR